MSLDDEKTVYMVMGTKLSYYTDPVTAYANLTLLTKPADDDWPDYGKETVTRKDLDYEMAFENNPNEIEGLSGSGNDRAYLLIPEHHKFFSNYPWYVGTSQHRAVRSSHLMKLQ